MEFGEWVLEVRKQKDWDIRTFGNKTGLGSSSVTRLESRRNQATVYTAFRICDTLDVSLYDLIYILDGRKLQWLLKDNLNKSEDVVTLKDIEKIIDSFYQDRDRVINEMVARLTELHQELDSSKRRYNGRKRSSDEEIVSATYTLRPYSVGEVDRLLFSSPLAYQYQLKYPSPVKVDAITRIYEQDGALMLQDAEAFLRKVKPGRPFVVSSASLSSIDRVRLSDILQADNEGKQEGRLLGVYWEACRFYSMFSPFGKFLPRLHLANYQNLLDDPESSIQGVEHEEWELRLATLYLMICRWEQYLGKDVVPLGA